VILDKTRNKPFVYLSIEEGVMEIKGSSFSKSVEERYLEIFKWIDENLPRLETQLECTFYFDMINTISYKCILEIFEKLCHYKNEEAKDINVTWYYDKDDEDCLEMAENISGLYCFPIDIRETVKKGVFK
jgi:hypothetical protein